MPGQLAFSRLLKFGGTNKPASFSARNSPDFDRLVTDIGDQDAIFAPFEGPWRPQGGLALQIA